MPVLGYWKIRGLAQPIRLMLGYADVDFEDKMYEVTDGPEFSRDAWFKEKFTLGINNPRGWDGRGCGLKIFFSFPARKKGRFWNLMLEAEISSGSRIFLDPPKFPKIGMNSINISASEPKFEYCLVSRKVFYNFHQMLLRLFYNKYFCHLHTSQSVDIDKLSKFGNYPSRIGLP